MSEPRERSGGKRGKITENIEL